MFERRRRAESMPRDSLIETDLSKLQQYRTPKKKRKYRPRLGLLCGRGIVLRYDARCYRGAPCVCSEAHNLLRRNSTPL